MSEVKADDAKTAVKFPKRAHDIQKFCHDKFSAMPTNIMATDDGRVFIAGASKTFLIFLDQNGGQDKISLSLLGDVAQSAYMYRELANAFNLEMIAPCCEDASDGLIKYGDDAYLALAKHRIFEARLNVESMAKQQGVLEEQNEAGIVGADGKVMAKDGPKIVTA